MSDQGHVLALWWTVSWSCLQVLRLGWKFCLIWKSVWWAACLGPPWSKNQWADTGPHRWGAWLSDSGRPHVRSGRTSPGTFWLASGCLSGSLRSIFILASEKNLYYHLENKNHGKALQLIPKDNGKINCRGNWGIFLPPGVWLQFLPSSLGGCSPGTGMLIDYVERIAQHTQSCRALSLFSCRLWETQCRLLTFAGLFSPLHLPLWDGPAYLHSLFFSFHMLICILCSYVLSGIGISLQIGCHFPSQRSLDCSYSICKVCVGSSHSAFRLILKWFHFSQVLCRSACFKLIDSFYYRKTGTVTASSRSFPVSALDHMHPH